MKTIVIAAVIFLMAAVIMMQTAENRDMIDAHHDYVRRTELKQAAIEARLATLERIGIRLDVIDHTGMWMVKGVAK